MFVEGNNGRCKWAFFSCVYYDGFVSACSYCMGGGIVRDCCSCIFLKEKRSIVLDCFYFLFYFFILGEENRILFVCVRFVRSYITERERNVIFRHLSGTVRRQALFSSRLPYDQVRFLTYSLINFLPFKIQLSSEQFDGLTLFVNKLINKVRACNFDWVKLFIFV